jgi:arylformamidase
MIDISVPIHNDMPTWPTSIGVRVTQVEDRASGAEANVSRLDCDVHTGTHVDAPCHFVDGGEGVDSLDLDMLNGRCHVADVRGQEAVTREVLAEHSIPENARRLLLRTDNSRWWAEGNTTFQEDYVALTVEAAEWVVEQDIDLIGVDYLSVQRFTDGPVTHEVLLSNEVIIVEGLNLTGVDDGVYELTCLPLRIVGADGAPARAGLQMLD